MVAQEGGKQVCCCLPDHPRSHHLQVTKKKTIMHCCHDARSDEVILSSTGDMPGVTHDSS